MDYNEMVKEAYEEIMGFDKEAAARWKKEYANLSSVNQYKARKAANYTADRHIRGIETGNKNLIERYTPEIVQSATYRKNGETRIIDKPSAFLKGKDKKLVITGFDDKGQLSGDYINRFKSKHLPEMKGELSGRDKKDFSALALRHELDEGRSLIKRKTKGNLLKSRYAGHTDPHVLHRESANLAFAPETAKRLMVAGRAKAGDIKKMEEDVKGITSNKKYKYGLSPYYDKKISKRHTTDWEGMAKFMDAFNDNLSEKIQSGVSKKVQNSVPKKSTFDVNSILSNFRKSL